MWDRFTCFGHMTIYYSCIVQCHGSIQKLVHECWQKLEIISSHVHTSKQAPSIPEPCLNLVTPTGAPTKQAIFAINITIKCATTHDSNSICYTVCVMLRGGVCESLLHNMQSIRTASREDRQRKGWSSQYRENICVCEGGRDRRRQSS